MREGLSSIGATGVAHAPVIPHPGGCVLSPTPPPTTTFVVATEWLAGGQPVVSVTGELDAVTAPALEEALLGLPDDGAGTVIVDLAGCSSMDLRGLRVLLSARKHLERSNRTLVLACGNPQLLRVFRITRVEGHFTIHPSLTAATERRHDLSRSPS